MNHLYPKKIPTKKEGTRDPLLEYPQMYPIIEATGEASQKYQFRPKCHVSRETYGLWLPPL